MNGPVPVSLVSSSPQTSQSLTVYRTNYDEHVIGWFILSVFLAAGLIIFLLLWIFSINDQQTQPAPSICFGPFGVQTGIDANALNICGTSRTDPCIFGMPSLSNAEAECNTLQSICNAFTYDDSTLTMKIVQPTNTFLSSSTNLFVRQSGIIS